MRRGFFVSDEPLAKLYVWAAGVGYHGRDGAAALIFARASGYVSFSSPTGEGRFL